MSVQKTDPSSRRARAVLAAGLSLVVLSLVLGAWLLPLERWLPAELAQLAPLDRTDSSCTMALTTTLKPDPQSVCDPVSITTTFEAACPACPEGLNVVFIQDDTPYPDWQKRVSLQALTELERYQRTGMPVSVGVIHYNGQGPRTALNPTLNLNAAKGPLRGFRVAHDPRAKFMEAAQEGVKMIRKGRRLHGDQANPECEFVIFFVYTKVYMSDMGQEMIQAGRTILRVTPNLYVGCPHQHPEECTIWEPQVPASKRYYTEDPEASKLLSMVRDGLRDIEDKGAVRMISLSTDQWIPDDLELIPGSYNIDPDEITAEGESARLTWNWRGAKTTDPISLTYKAQPRIAGNWQSELANTWRDSMNRQGERRVLSEPIEVYDEVCQTPTPTVTSLPSPTPTGTQVPSETPEATSTPIPTVTPRPKPIYLPVLVGEECIPGEAYVDVVLIIDVSTSMLRQGRSGQTKLAATQDAAKQFVSLMDLSPDSGGGHDQVGIVGFNKNAWIQAALGSDIKEIHAAIDALTERTAEFTRLDLALEVGAEAIIEGPRLPDNTPVIILLTDGLPNQVPYDPEDGTAETTVLLSATAAKEAGIAVFTIAIGDPDDTNPVLLTLCASTPNHYYYTPDAEDLAAIYQAIARKIECPPSRFWGRR